LAGYDAAIVTEIPGTTRDVLRERIDIDGLPLHVLDTAGLRDSDDAVEREGVRRAAAEMSRADRVLFVIDASNDSLGRAFAEERQRLPQDVPVTLIFNKIDIAEGLPMADTVSGPPRIHVSAVTGAGLAALRSHLKGCVSFQTAGNGSISARKRHLEALSRARQCVETASRELQQRRAGELVAEELRLAQLALEEVTGVFTADDLLGRIFGSFCIGK
jgi:tRNA modification GTPase